jgi:phenylalanine-4-hydroxylase
LRRRLGNGLVIFISGKHSPTEHRTWEILFKRQTSLLKGRVTKRFILGMQLLGMPANGIPDRITTSRRLQELNGWELWHTDIAYMSDHEWWMSFSRKAFFVTDYIRSPQQLDFIPEPDMFHDYFGHLAFMTDPEYTAMVELFSKAFQAAPEHEKHKIARVWWHTFEFGLIREDGEIRVLGAGLISSKEELLHCLEPGRQQPFDFSQAMETEIAIANVHNEYLVLESFEQLRGELENYVQRNA